MTTPIGAGSGVISADTIKSLDIETALMAVQSNRANLLESQLKDQVSAVQAKNEQISKLNQALGDLNKLAALFSGDAKADAKLGDAKGFWDNNALTERTANDALNAAGLTGLFSNTSGHLTNWQPFPYGPCSTTTKGQLDGAIQQLKSQIDSMSNTQQMDMLRLQSLSNKRNEAFEIMTNFVKKNNDNRASIVGNMR